MNAASLSSNFAGSIPFNANGMTDDRTRASRSAAASHPMYARPLSLNTLLLGITQLLVMNQNGVDLAEAVETVALNAKCPRLREAMTRIHLELTRGLPLSAAVRMTGNLFPPSVAPMLEAAERSGNLPQTLKRIAELLRGELAIRATIINATIYPAILILVSTLVMAAMLLGVVPQFAKVFESLGKPIPTATHVLLGISQTCQAYWPLLAASLIAAIACMVAYRHHPFVMRPLRATLMNGPMIRDAYRPMMTGRVFRSIASMIGGGVPLLESVTLTRNAIADPYWTRLLDEVTQSLLEGKAASDPMRQVDFLPAEAAQMVATAEKTGRMFEVLEDVGLFYEEDATRKLKRLVAALEPAIIMVMGLFVAGIVMSVMLPMLDVTTIR
jgi:type II secretory pathway component PulF